MIAADRAYWAARFRKVILGAGYSEAAADWIMKDWLNVYLKDLPAFREMLESYEKEQV